MISLSRLILRLSILLLLFGFPSYYLLFGDRPADIYTELFNLSKFFHDEPTEVSINYSRNPLVFLHGHSFIGQRTVLYSLSGFEGFQELMEKRDLYQNRGIFLLTNTTRNLPDLAWRYNSSPPSFRVTYYADETDQAVNILIKKENQKSIGEYSMILGKNIDEILRLTGAQRVDIVAHSMGGLVARDYTQRLGGSERVDRLIMIGTPNRGMRGSLVDDFCNLLHPGAECSDMQKGSIFLTELNSANLSAYTIEYLSIVGQCCSWPGNPEFTDEVVFVSDALLPKTENVKNIVIYGTENKALLGTFHEDMLKPGLYPEVFNKTVSFLLD